MWIHWAFLLHIAELFIISCIVSPLILHVIRFLFRKYNIIDRPHLYKTEQGRPPAPYWVGILIILVLLLCFPLMYCMFDFSQVLERRLHIVLAIGVIIAIVSFIDDMDTIGKTPMKVSPLLRLFMQICIGAVIGLTSIKIDYIFGWIFHLTDYFMDFHIWEKLFTVYYIPVLITIFWYVLVFNSVNFSDWVPWLTWGFSLITFLILGWLAFKLMFTDMSIAAMENSQFILMLLSVIIPSTFWLTRADISRKVIMGDSGTIMLAFLIATLAIIAGGKIATAISVTGVYLIDLIYVVTMRIMKGQNPLKWDQTYHLHYRLMELGFSQAKIRNIIYFLAGFFGITAIFLDSLGKMFLFVIIAFITVFLTQILSIIKK